ncbi:hypothetical protein CEUSTIGMA_g12719.t1 [Chlamydomonas eustigma]|uniref:ABC transporter domain-containing protein n=1 Tax=Chlamydomonas eustigma TaxID=1157962 RepID=A0A250XQU5_9CHLO|nr:hypothetical protein CEUSTIGMA_g12719.t1 [Chlamydomonas eustigma]|eukprot:GAX85302.1 hypothetical protein CEUSTIGMA_g12719.t1 [Chlamydomonas eustigma]
MLCDRPGIFVDGQLVCIGNPKEITHRYAGYLVFTITVPLGKTSKAKRLVQSMSPHSSLTYEVGGTLKYDLHSQDVMLSGVFEAMNILKQQMVVIDWGVSNATLEEVFLKLVRSGGIKTEEHL